MDQPARPRRPAVRSADVGRPKIAAAGASTSAPIRTTRPAFNERPPTLVSREGELRERRVMTRADIGRGKENVCAKHHLSFRPKRSGEPEPRGR